MATQTNEATSEFGKNGLALKMKRASVKVIMGGAVWSGTIIASRAGKTLVLTVAHSVFNTANWMSLPQIEQAVTVQFYGTIVLLPCRVAFLQKESDMMLLVVDKETPDDHKLKLAPEGEWELVESQLLGARGHPQGQHEWTLADGQVCTPKLVNDGFYNVMPEYYPDMRFFEHRLDLGKGCSGAALVNLNGNIVGMQTGMPGKDYKVLLGEKMSDAVKDRVKQLHNEFYNKFYVDKADLNPFALAVASKELDSNISNATVGLASLHYGSNDAVDIPVTLSQIKYAIHVEYIKKIIQGNGNKSLEDIYMPDPPAIGSSTARYHC